MLFIPLLINLVASFNYSNPIIIETGITNREFIFLYDQELQLIFTAYDSNVIIYNLDGKLVKSLILNVTINKMIVTENSYLLITSNLYNTVYEYNLDGNYMSQTDICGYNYKNALLPNYLILDLGWIYDVYSYSLEDKLIGGVNGFDNSFDQGKFSNNLLVGAGNVFTAYDQKLNNLIQITLYDPDPDAITKSFEINKTSICIVYDKFYIYSYDGNLISTFKYNRRPPFILKDKRFNYKHQMITFIDMDYINNKNVP